MNLIRIKAPAHLHTGNPPDLSGDMGRLYGTVGFAIEIPSLEIEVRKSDRDISNDPDVLRFLKRFRESYDFPPVEITVHRYIPKWVGIGFHTTLALTMGGRPYPNSTVSACLLRMLLWPCVEAL
ncbi:hypothetical protein [Thermococcus peptonophilus]|uniref:hypothetical protein n=1 Tax=Thermococcus peptonophilus TaxID=53952 RepID=UPI0034662A93